MMFRIQERPRSIEADSMWFIFSQRYLVFPHKHWAMFFLGSFNLRYEVISDALRLSAVIISLAHSGQQAYLSLLLYGH